jgi:hypothetical protein
MTAGDLTTGRRVASIHDIELPGDYYGPVVGYTGDGMESCFFLLPNARGELVLAEDVPGRAGQRAVHHVNFPPHTYRECADGSLEIRASIGAMPWWHGFLDEGHIWRKV